MVEVLRNIRHQGWMHLLGMNRKRMFNKSLTCRLGWNYDNNATRNALFSSIVQYI